MTPEIKEALIYLAFFFGGYLIGMILAVIFEKLW